MKFETFITIELRDKEGHLYERKKFRPNSYVRALIDLLFPGFQAANFTNGGVDTGGTTRTLAQTYMLLNAGTGVTTYGIRVGTGTNAVTISDYTLQTPIAEGSGAGQLLHSAVTFNSPSTSGSTRQFNVMRTLTNNSGNSITVKEIALYASFNSNYFMIERTLNTFTILNGASATVTYTISVTV